jgi:hypothetical protein
MYKKLIIVFIAMFAIAIFFVSRQSSDRNDSFSLLDQIEERQIIGVFNLNKLLTDGLFMSDRFRTFGLAESYFEEVSSVLKNSGLRLDKVYYSLETRKKYKRSLYFQITNQEKLKNTFNEFSAFYELERDSLDTSIYYSKEYSIAIRIENQWIEVIQGNVSDLDHKPSLSSSARSLLREEHFFIINPTDKAAFDSLEYITGNYHFDSILTIEGSWFCNRAEDHPVQLNKNKISVYPTSEDIISAYLNVNRERWQHYQNDYLKGSFENAYSKGMIDYPRLSELWTGQFAFNFGGIKTMKTKTVVTEFDENFNQIEKTVIQQDTVRDVGLVFSSNNPEQLHQELLNQKNIKSKNGSTYIGLLPPMKPTFLKDELILGASLKRSKLIPSNDILQFTFKSSQLNIEANAITETNHLKYRIQLIPQVSGRIKWGELLNVFL